MRALAGKALAAALAAAILANPVQAQVEGPPMNDDEIRGYTAAILEREFNVKRDAVTVQDGVVRIRADLPESDRTKIEEALKTVNGVERVEIVEGDTRPVGVTWLPGHSQFKPLLADPRWPHFSVAYRYYFDGLGLTSVGSVNLGETFALARYNFENGGAVELAVQAGVFAIFDLPSGSSDLVNADYLGAIPVTYARGNFSAMVRVQHQSSHLGDEYVLEHDIDRVNLSYEQFDTILSYEFSPEFRGYGGGGYIFRSEPSLNPWFTHFGAEWISHDLDLPLGLKPLAAIDLQNREETDWNANLSLRAGIQSGKPIGVGRNIQLLVEFYNGQDFDGQFYGQRVTYLGLGAHLYF